MTKVIFVLIDGLDLTSSIHMSFLGAHKEQQALCGQLDCELPTVSRPIYSTLFTGKSPLQTNITHNGQTFLTQDILEQSFFAKLYSKGKTCAMAAHYWMREIYTGEIYNSAIHRLSFNLSGPITHGIFYNNDNYPDEYVFQDAKNLELLYKPDFLLVHSMGVDTAGHAHGANSAPYRFAVRKVDALLAEYVPTWLAQGSMVIITSDHGMHADGAHNDLQAEVRRVPYWILGANNSVSPPTNQKQWYHLLYNYFML